MPREHLADEGRGRCGVEHEVGLGRRDLVVGKGVVQQVVEDPAVEVGRLVELSAEPVGSRGAGAVAHADGQPAELAGVGGNDVCLPVVKDLQPMLHGPQKGVCAFQDLAFLIGEAARLGEPADGLERGAGTDPRRVAAAEQLQELDRELHVADPAAAVFHVGGVGALADRQVLDPPLERLDAADVGPGEPAAIDPRFHLSQQPAAQPLVAGDAPRLHPRLPLPGAAVAVVVLQHRLQRHGGRPGGAVRAQPQVDPVGDSQIGGFGDQPHRLLRHPLEELLVRAGLWPLHPAVGRVHEHEIDVAGIVELHAAELAQGQHGQRGPLAAGPAGDAPEPFHPVEGRRDRRLHHAVGHVRELRDDGLQPLPPDDISVGDAQRLAPLEPPHGPHHALGLRHERRLGGQRGGQRFPALRPPLPHPDLLPRLGVEDHQFSQMGTRREELEQDLQASRIPLEERAHGERAADGAGQPLDGDQHAIGIADVGQLRRQPSSQALEQVERESLVGEGQQRPVRERRIGEPRGATPRRRGGRIVEQPPHLRDRAGDVGARGPTRLARRADRSPFRQHGYAPGAWSARGILIP